MSRWGKFRAKLAGVVVCLLMGAAVVSAQEYRTGIGLRGGMMSSGLDVRYNFNPSNALDVLLSLQFGPNLFLLYERNLPIIGAGFTFYYGGGVNVGFWEQCSIEFTAGVSAVAGLEYKIKGVPLAVALDYKPILNFVGATSPAFTAWDLGICLRAVF